MPARPSTPTLLALLVGTFASASALAQATGSVTLSGTLDLAVRDTRNEGVGSMRSIVSGSNSTSRIAVTGREDLGGGTWAGFHLEHGILADTGAGVGGTSKFWDRRSTVSLGHASWGELRLGRDTTPSYNNWGRYDPFSYVGAARSANLVSATPVGPIRSAFGTNANTTVRADNLLQWVLPKLGGGLEGEIALAPGEGGSATAGHAKLTGARIGWAAKTWGVSASVVRVSNSLTTTGDFADDAIGGHWQATPQWRLTAAWRSFKQAQSKQTLTMLGAVGTYGAHEWKMSIVDANLAGRVGTTVVDANDARQIGAGYAYHLSRRTAVYTQLALVDNAGAARFVVSDGPAGMAGGGSSRGVELGIRHRF